MDGDGWEAVGTAGRLDLVSFACDRCTAAVSRILADLGYHVTDVPADDWIGGEPPESIEPSVLLLGDRQVPRTDLLARLRRPTLPPILGICCSNDAGLWDDEILRGCADFVGWPCHAAELVLRLRVVMARGGLDASRAADETRLLEEFVDLNMMGRSSPFTQTVKLLKRFARCDAPVLVEGDTGTGKELAARATHYLSARRDYPFIAVNCGAIPDNLVENELFGHERGAFTDAKRSQPGLVAQAHRGTLMLDEIDALSPKAQVTLLRFLEHKEYRSLGGTKTQHADVRVIAATNTDLRDSVREGLFRKDLLFRLNVLFVRLPLLRDRGDDVLLLARHFIRSYGARYRQPIKSLHPATVDWMMRHPWPGNVRELENLLHRAFLLTDGPVITLPQAALGSGHPAPGAPDSVGFPTEMGEMGLTEAKAQVVDSFERTYLKWLIRETGGNISAAARRAGRGRSALRRLLKKHGIPKRSA